MLSFKDILYHLWAVLYGCYVFYLNIGLMILSLVCVFNQWWYILGAIFVFYMYETYVNFTDKREYSLENFGASKISLLNENSCQAYWPMKLRMSEGRAKEIRNYIDQGKKIIFCFHPHGVSALSHHVISYGSNEMKRHGLGDVKIKKLAASAVFKIPLFKRQCIACNLTDASRKNAEKVLNSKDWHMYICVGGEKEQLENHRDSMFVYIKRRLGFIKLAMKRKDTVILPIYAFGENEMYTPIKMLLDFRIKFAEKTRFAIFGGIGTWWSPLFPKKIPVNVCVGKPIKVYDYLPKDQSGELKDPEKLKIAKNIQAEYIKNLEDVFEENKVEYGFGYENKKLNIQ